MSKDTSYMNMQFEEHMLQRYSEVDLFSTRGRIGRKRYFISSVIIPFIIFWSFASIAGLLTHLGSVASLISYAFLGLATIAMFFILVRLTIQRCHDLNKSAWLSVLALIPLANIIFALIPGTNGLNQYGEPPEPASAFIKIAFYGLITLIMSLFAVALLQFFTINVNGWFSL